MLSLQHCRKILGVRHAISDDELVTLRDQLYCFAELAWTSEIKGMAFSRPLTLLLNR